MRQVDYQVVEATDPDKLRRKVLELAQQDFQCQGGVHVVALGEDDYLYTQAMVKDDYDNT